MSPIDTLVVAAARGLFEANGLALGGPEPDGDEVENDHDIAASIGFTSPQAQGAILMTTRKVVVASAWPGELRNRVPTERQTCDWAGELVNQLLGRIKNALIPFRLTLEQSTPTVVVGTHVHRAPAATNVARRYFFLVGKSSILVYFDASMAAGLVLSGLGDANLRSAAEGDLQLF